MLLSEVIDRLELRSGSVILDGTVGLGGHSVAILEMVGPDGLLIGIDRDAEALDRARERLKAVGSSFSLFRGLFTQVREAVIAAGRNPEGGLDGILLDLGVSSSQLDTPERGFSFSRDGPLDMRMGLGVGESATEWLSRSSRQDIERVLREFGEEPAAGRIAHAIERARQGRAITTTADLVRVVESVVPQGKRRIHPATRTFQAIRIQVNDELGLLDSFLQQVDRHLVLGGRLVVLSYHSLEDRLVKRCLRSRARQGIFRVEKPEVIRPSEEEVLSNPRARSARLRWAIRGG